MPDPALGYIPGSNFHGQYPLRRLHRHDTSQELGTLFSPIQTGRGDQGPVNAAVRRRSSGRTSLANQGWRRSQAVLRHEG